MALYYISVTLHVLAALFWLGGMFFLALVGAPVLRRVEPPALRAELFSALGLGFRRFGWGAITLLVATGVLNLHFRGLLASAVWTEGQFWSTVMGRALAGKLATVTLMIVLSALHDFWLGPAAARAVPGSSQSIALRRASAWIARLNALLGILLIIAAVRLTRG